MLLLSFQLHYHLHSTVVLLKVNCQLPISLGNSNLHSTVVLLKVGLQYQCFSELLHLHSTVVLLKGILYSSNSNR